MTRTADRSRSRRWVDRAVALIEADARRSADTHLLRYPLPSWSVAADLQLYLKDETTHITGSLKHRLARSLFLYALCNGLITEDTAAVVEASSGSTAVSEAYFAALLDVPFIAVMPRSTSAARCDLRGGGCWSGRPTRACVSWNCRLATWSSSWRCWTAT